MSLLEKALKRIEESKKAKIQEEKKVKIKESIPKEKLPKIREGIDFSNMTITQDDLWFLYRLKIGEGTRNKRTILLPKFTEVFNKNLNEMRKIKEV